MFFIDSTVAAILESAWKCMYILTWNITTETEGGKQGEKIGEQRVVKSKEQKK